MDLRHTERDAAFAPIIRCCPDHLGEVDRDTTEAVVDEDAVVTEQVEGFIDLVLLMQSCEPRRGIDQLAIVGALAFEVQPIQLVERRTYVRLVEEEAVVGQPVVVDTADDQGGVDEAVVGFHAPGDQCQPVTTYRHRLDGVASAELGP
jgi:hypothetical protein